MRNFWKFLNDIKFKLGEFSNVSGSTPQETNISLASILLLIIFFIALILIINLFKEIFLTKT